MAGKKKTGKNELLIPKLRKSLKAFAKGERGQISKHSMVTVGSIVGGAAIGAAIATKGVRGAGIRLFAAGQREQNIVLGGPGNNITITMTDKGEIIGTHSHHSSY